METYDKKAKIAIALAIITFLYYFVVGLMILVLIAFRAPTRALILALIIPFALSSVGFLMAKSAKVKDGRKGLSGIVLNSITLGITVIFCILFILTKTVFL